MVSVILPTYNREKVILRAVNSVLAQSYEELELIIVDDGSVDDTERVVKSVPDQRITYLKIENGGPARARNYGISMAKGSYIALIDSDDSWKKDKLQKAISCLETYNGDIVFSNLQIHAKKTYVAPALAQGIVDLNTLMNGNKVMPPALIAKADVFKECKFDEELSCLEDYEWVIRAASKYSFVFCDDILGDVFAQKDSLNIYGKVGEASFKILEKHEEFLNDFPITKAIFLSKASVFCEKEFGDGFPYIYEAWTLNHCMNYFIRLILGKLKILNPIYTMKKKFL